MEVFETARPEEEDGGSYLIWKKNSKYLYDNLVTASFDWPALSVAWMGGLQQDKDGRFIQKMVYGTQTDGTEQNHLIIAEIKYPTNEVPKEEQTLDSVMNEYGGHKSGLKVQLTSLVKMNHDGEVNKVAVMPQDQKYVASRTVGGDVHVFNYYQQQSASADGAASPNFKLVGLTGDGFGLTWNSILKGHLASCDVNGVVCRWDMSYNLMSKGKKNPIINAAATYNFHGKNPVNDLAYCREHSSLLGSVGDDGRLVICDTRNDEATIQIEAHGGEASTMDFSYHHPLMVATAGTEGITDDGSIKIWDLRQISKPLHEIAAAHNKQIINIQWSPHHENLVATSGEDGSLRVWDLCLSGHLQNDGRPDELMFSHEALGSLHDFSWNTNKNYPFTFASSHDSDVMVWTMDRRFVEYLKPTTSTNITDDNASSLDDLPVEESKC